MSASSTLSSQQLRVRAALACLGLGLTLVVWGALPRPALAAEPAALQAAGKAETARSYVVVSGDTLDRIVQKTKGQSPLRIELLRQALADANPQAITTVRNPRLKVGTVLQLPDHEALLRATVLPLLPPADAAALSPAGGADARKRWVRYP